MGFDKETKRNFLTAFLISLAFYVESCICDGRARAVSQSYINRSRQTNVNWNRRWHGVGLFEESCICDSGTIGVRQCILALWRSRGSYNFCDLELVIISCQLALGTVSVTEVVSAHSEASTH